MALANLVGLRGDDGDEEAAARPGGAEDAGEATGTAGAPVPDLLLAALEEEGG